MTSGSACVGVNRRDPVISLRHPLVVVGNMIGDRPPQPLPARACGEVEYSSAVAGNYERGVPELQVGVRQCHLDLVVGSPQAGVERSDDPGDTDVLAAGLRSDPGQRLHEPDLEDQVCTGCRGCQGVVVVVVGRSVGAGHWVSLSPWGDQDWLIVSTGCLWCCTSRGWSRAAGGSGTGFVTVTFSFKFLAGEGAVFPRSKSGRGSAEAGKSRGSEAPPGEAKASIYGRGRSHPCARNDRNRRLPRSYEAPGTGFPPPVVSEPMMALTVISNTHATKTGRY